VKNPSGSIHISVVIACTAVAFLAGCAHVPTANQSVAAPVPAGNFDLLQVATDAARAVGLPAVTKFDKAQGVVEFGSSDMGATGYTAQVRRRPDGQLDVTVKGESANVPGSVEDKAREFTAALDARLRRVAAPPPPEPSGVAPSASIPPAASRQEPAPAPRSQTILTVVVTAPHANLRDGGDAKAKVVRVLPKNTRLIVLGKTSQWYLVRLDDGTGGWVAESVTSPAP
jgi:hypothetical protein